MKLMMNEIKILAEIYLKNGSIIREKVSINKGATLEDITAYIADLRDSVSNDFKNNENFYFIFGFTTVRGCDISAISIRPVKESDEFNNNVKV